MQTSVPGGFRFFLYALCRLLFSFTSESISLDVSTLSRSSKITSRSPCFQTPVQIVRIHRCDHRRWRLNGIRCKPHSLSHCIHDNPDHLLGFFNHDNTRCLGDFADGQAKSLAEVDNRDNAAAKVDHALHEVRCPRYG